MRNEMKRKIMQREESAFMHCLRKFAVGAAALFAAGMLLVSACGAGLTSVAVLAGQKERLYTDPSTNYSVYIDDAADLLTEQEEENLVQTMKEITPYGNAIFVTSSERAYSAEEEAEEKYYEYLPDGDSGVLFLIDMYNRKIQMYCDGGAHKTLTNSYATTITDNAYAYASRGDYAGCAEHVFGQAATLLQGGRIAQPMRIITCALLACILAFLLNFVYVLAMRSSKKASRAEIVGAMTTGFTAAALGSALLHQRRIFSPRSGSRGHSGGGHFGGGGGGFSGGGHSGGGHTGGGGGHSF